jgi:hypothetical protein
MRTIHITHHDEGPHGWWFTSPDIRLTGGPDNNADFEASCRWAEDAVRFHLEGEAEERGESQVEEARVVHLVATPASA